MSGCFRRPTLLVLALAAASLAARPTAAQVSLVPARHPVYEWLRYQRVAGNAPDYVHEALPLSRKEVTEILREIDAHRDRLTASDRTVLDTYLQEFSLESLKASTDDNFIRGEGSFVERLWKNPVDQKEPHLYAETGDGYAYAVDIWRGRALTLVREGEEDYRTAFGDLGFRGYAEIGDHVGLHLEAGNAGVSIDRRGILLDPDYGKSFSVIEEGKSNSVYVEASTSLRFGPVSADIGHGALRYGVGQGPPLTLSTLTPRFDWVRLRFDSEHFRYSALHGSLISPLVPDSRLILGQDTIRSRHLTSRRLALHRFSILPVPQLELSFTEMVTYSGRELDLAYINPVNLIFFSEKEGGTRDNVAWVMETVARPVEGVELHGAVFIDDAKTLGEVFGKETEGTDNPDRAFDVGASVALRGWDLTGRYLRIEPWVYTHFGLDGFQQRGFPLGHPLGPNTDQWSVGLGRWLPHRTHVRGRFSRTRLGLNPVDQDGNLILNVGGDLTLGERPGETYEQLFLQGADIQEYDEITVEGFTEPLRGIELSFRFRNRSMRAGTRVADRRIMDFRAKVFTPLAPVFAYLIPEF